ncbi:hypothetical protein MAR_007651 [Mya arenaria]|uniref:Antistasin-like domain-containing protein n=1 Tax=Mya arenaria TaxID=6604 RepID=A0ABY7DTM5_MYAAR|nr:hypothetical protein MAR_007651 [Mya arenaria]
MELVLFVSLFGTVFSATSTSKSTGVILQAKPTVTTTLPVSSNVINATEIESGQSYSGEYSGNETYGSVDNMVDNIATNMSEKDIHNAEGVGPEFSRKSGSVAIGEITIMKETKIAGKPKADDFENKVNGKEREMDRQSTKREFGQVKNATYVPKCSEVDDPFVQCAMDFPLDVIIPPMKPLETADDANNYSSVKNDTDKKPQYMTTTKQTQYTSSSISEQSQPSDKGTITVPLSQTDITLTSTQSSAVDPTGPSSSSSDVTTTSVSQGDAMTSTVEMRTNQSQTSTANVQYITTVAAAAAAAETIESAITTASPTASDALQTTESQTTSQNNDQQTTHLQTTTILSNQETKQKDTLGQTTVQTQEQATQHVNQNQSTPTTQTVQAVQTQELTTQQVNQNQSTPTTQTVQAQGELQTCPVLSCSTECPHGIRLDSNGCPTCMCLCTLQSVMRLGRRLQGQPDMLPRRVRANMSAEVQ